MVVFFKPYLSFFAISNAAFLLSFASKIALPIIACQRSPRAVVVSE
ncbi:MAG: hypothetical protein HYW50_00065 [Candidatus Diapherotrites archaeon]|nr:hypothetical protein [Candidatus Diapherotrites archaeon]